MAERAFEGVVGQFGDLPGHFDAGGSGADHHESEQLGPADRVTGALGLLEGAQDAATQFQRVVDGLHTGRPLGEMVIAEVGLARAGRHDQGVVRRPVGVAEQHRVDRPALEVDSGDLAEQHLAVLVVFEDDPGQRGDLALGDDAGGHLVQQRLEQVVGGLGDHLDVDVGAFEALHSLQAAESGADDDDLVLIRRSSTGMGHSSSLLLRVVRVSWSFPTLLR